MSKRGENIYKRKDGRWEGRKLVYIPFKKRVSVYGKTYREVRGKLAALTTGSYQPAPPVTVETTVSEWLALKRRQLKESSCVKYRSLAVLHLIPLIGQLPVRQVGRETVVQLADVLTRQSKPGSPGLSSKTVRDVLRILREALELRLGKSAFSWELSGHIPQQKGPRRASVLTAEEQDRLERVLLSSVDSRNCGILLCLYAGFRIGELCALRWRDVDLINRVVTVSRTLQRLQCPPEWGADGQTSRTKITETPPKSEDSERTAPLAEPLAQQLERLDPHAPDAYVLTGTGAYIECNNKPAPG